MTETCVADIIGDWGKWQSNVFFFCMVNYILQSFNSLSYYFYAADTDFWCNDDPPLEGQNLSRIEKCQKFSDCQEWKYEDAHRSTIIREWDLVCERAWLTSFTQMVYMFGYIPSGLILLLVADRIGRKPIIWLSFILELISGIACVMSTSVWQFIVSRGFLGIGVCVRGNVLFALFFESCGKKYRGDAGLLLTSGWIIGIMFLSGVAYLLPNFRALQLIALGMLIFLIIWSIFIDESVRWQMTHNQEEAATKTLLKALRINRGDECADGELKHQITELGKSFKEEAKKEANTPKATIGDLFRHKKLRQYILIFWIAVPINSFIYYGISFGIGHLGGDLYLTQIAAGIAEVPGLIFSLFVIHNYGRRLFTSYNMILTGLVSLLAIFMISFNGMKIFFTILAKFFITNSYNVIIIQGSEIFPTVLRTAAGGSITMISRIGAMAAPFVTMMINSYGQEFVLFIFAITAIIGGCLAYFLPETKSKDIPDTIKDTEALG